MTKVIIAYEPVWAISTTTGARLASPGEIGDIVNFLRRLLSETYGKENMENVLFFMAVALIPPMPAAILLSQASTAYLSVALSLIGEQFTDIIEIAKRVRD